MVDLTKPLRPLDFVVQLTEKLGPAEPHVVGVDGDRDISTKGWIVGRGQTIAQELGRTAELQRGTDVEILLTVGGTLITTRCSWTRGLDGEEVSQTGKPHETPDLAYRWLVNDGKGKLGPASKQAWSEACRTVPPMSGLEFEHVK
jgi:hypothetical protein